MTANPPAERPARMSRREWRANNAASAEGTLPTGGGSLSILIVCTGNICRSPMAETVLRARLEPLDVHVRSAGTHALVGHEMTEPAQALAVEAGAATQVVTAHSARYLVEPMLIEADLVLTMTRDHRSHSVKMVPSQVRRTFAIREFARLASSLSNDDLTSGADAVGADATQRLAGALQRISAQRIHTASPSAEDDVIDPYRRSPEIYAQMAAQLIPALDEVERVVRLALG